MNGIQAQLIGSSLDLEIKTWHGSKMKMTREPAMKTLERLTGIDTYATFGKGLQGRINALEWLEEVMLENGIEPFKRLNREA